MPDQPADAQPDTVPATFNLLDEAWLPVERIDGSRDSLSLVEVFAQSRQITRFVGDLPLQDFTLHRLLLAVLYGVIPGGPSAKQWRSLWQNGFPGAVTAYLERYRHRFDLLDDEQPFFQVADLTTSKGEMTGLERLILDVPNGHLFFTTRSGRGLSSISLAEAARWLVTVQAYDPSGIKSGALGDDRVKGGKGYPIGIAWAGHLGGLLVTGRTLHETLLLNFAGQEVQPDVRWTDRSSGVLHDVPVWQRPQPTAAASLGLDQPSDAIGGTTYFHGPATLYTWQSRRIRLGVSGDRVTSVLLANGDTLKPQNAHQYEPMTAWRKSEPQAKKLKMSTVYMPLEHQPDRALWRGVAQFLPVSLPQAGADRLPSLTTRWLSRLQAEHLIGDDQLVRLKAFGVEYGSQSSVVDEVISDDLDLPLSVLSSSDPTVKGLLDSATALADSGVGEATRFAANIAQAAGQPVEGPRRQVRERAFELLDSAFRKWVQQLTADAAQDTTALSAWQDAVRDILRTIGDELIASAPPTAWTGREVSSGPKGERQQRDLPHADLWYRAAVRKLIPAEADPNTSAIA
ncbi:type I-E CRISPR-associated protein Cse1/CasA [Pseudoclavibacter sp. CFCC 13611]|uniref:type I-E CRISPR-associated protein Cse1/CasA n=1 Tax=Pseudoclavibacter sp. CFCC 13611 TaxID=2615178 RepID=UPI00130184A5|nr:type I-E CRISPR-associated protein Cse1/CasA [Pseudoclavibacter sp. CFCC 13611]KAB1662979.1 type I-E CRISPR-associated protein Cse1/CasA [Pseudoclavibacter sp. CFCC 13611]